MKINKATYTLYSYSGTKKHKGESGKIKYGYKKSAILMIEIRNKYCFPK